MRLTALDPRWVTLQNWQGGPFWFGVNFKCPHCGTVFVGAYFKNPIDPENYIGRGIVNWEAYMRGNPKQEFWDRTGDSFETLTLSPSIDASKHGHWHGSLVLGVVNGNVLIDYEREQPLSKEPV